MMMMMMMMTYMGEIGNTDMTSSCRHSARRCNQAYVIRQ